MNPEVLEKIESFEEFEQFQELSPEKFDIIKFCEDVKTCPKSFDTVKKFWSLIESDTISDFEHCLMDIYRDCIHFGILSLSPFLSNSDYACNTICNLPKSPLLRP